MARDHWYVNPCEGNAVAPRKHTEQLSNDDHQQIEHRFNPFPRKPSRATCRSLRRQKRSTSYLSVTPFLGTDNKAKIIRSIMDKMSQVVLRQPVSHFEHLISRSNCVTASIREIGCLAIQILTPIKPGHCCQQTFGETESTRAPCHTVPIDVKTCPGTQASYQTGGQVPTLFRPSGSVVRPWGAAT